MEKEYIAQEDCVFCSPSEVQSDLFVCYLTRMNSGAKICISGRYCPIANKWITTKKTKKKDTQ